MFSNIFKLVSKREKRSVKQNSFSVLKNFYFSMRMSRKQDNTEFYMHTRSHKHVLHNVSRHAYALPGNVVLAADEGGAALCWRTNLDVKGNPICGSTISDKI
jgi:hypothetical protein